jgi:hypothetical protein
MADLVCRQMAFYWRSKKAVTANKVSVDFTMNREPMYGQEGILAWSKGHAMMKITASGFTPVGGSFTSDDIDKILNQDDIPVSFVLGGKFYSGQGIVQNLKYDSDSEKGTTVEEVQLSCKRPQIAG